MTLLKFLIPLPAVPSDLESETENIEPIENDNGDKPNSYGFSRNTNL